MNNSSNVLFDDLVRRIVEETQEILASKDATPLTRKRAMELQAAAKKAAS